LTGVGIVFTLYDCSVYIVYSRELKVKSPIACYSVPLKLGTNLHINSKIPRSLYSRGAAIYMKLQPHGLASYGSVQIETELKNEVVNNTRGQFLYDIQLHTQIMRVFRQCRGHAVA
jgi:hypothetical protein